MSDSPMRRIHPGPYIRDGSRRYGWSYGQIRQRRPRNVVDLEVDVVYCRGKRKAVSDTNSPHIDATAKGVTICVHKVKRVVVICTEDDPSECTKAVGSYGS